MIVRTAAVLSLLFVMPILTCANEPAWYVKCARWQDTLEASVAALRQGHAGHDLQLSDWSWVGPFAIPGSRDMDKVFATPFAPEIEPLDLGKPLEGTDFRWAIERQWKDATVNRIGTEEFAAYYVTRTITAPAARRVTAYFGSDDAITVWLNDKPILAHLVGHWCAPDQENADLNLHAGENRLTIKITNGVQDAAFYFSLQPHAVTANVLTPLWDRLIRDFPAAAQEIAWIREDGIFSDDPAVRFYRYDDPQVRLRGQWQYTIAGAPGGFARRSDQAGDEATVNFVGDSVALLHKEGVLERSMILSRDAEQLYGLAAITLDGQPVEPHSPIMHDGEGNSVIDTSRDAHVVLGRGLTPSPHRLTITNLGRPSHPDGSTAVAVVGFFVGVESGPAPLSRAWRYALAVRGGKAWQARASELATDARDASGLEAVTQLYFASREADAVAARLRSLRDRPPSSPMVERERNLWHPQPDTLAYFARLSALKLRAEDALAEAEEFRYDPLQAAAFTTFVGGLRRLADDIDACLTAEVRKLPPIVFFTGAPLESGAVPNYIWQSNPLGGRWGCSIRLWDPAHPARPAQVLFEDSHSIIFDLQLSYDAKTVFFSMRRDGQQYWQIYEMGIDGQHLKQITDGDFYNVCPVPLADGRLAYLSSRTPGSHTVCQSGPSMHVSVMNRDGSEPSDLSANTLTDFGLSVLRDGRLLFTRWEYVDSDLSYRQSLWTIYPDGRQLKLYFGNTITDPASFWQAREIPGRDAVVCTMAPHHGSPYGAIGIAAQYFGVEAPRDAGFRWVTEEFPNVEDLNPFWAYRDPCPVGESQFLVSYGGGGLQRFRIFLLDEMDNRMLVYDDPGTSCFYPQPVRPRSLPAHIPDWRPESIRYVDVPAAPPGQPKAERVATGCFAVTDVYQGLEPEVARGRVASIRIMEQIPKTVDTTWYRVYDQGPLMSGGTTYYAKRCWGYASVEEDGSAYFEAPAGKELYFQVCDAEGRELRRMTSGTQLMAGEIQGCIGCHESRDTTQPNRPHPLALRRGPSPLKLPEWGNAGVIDYVRVIQPILDRHCVRCHSGTAPDGGILLSGGFTRFFNMSYDNLVVRSQSAQVSTDLYLGFASDLPLVQFNNMFPGIYTALPPLTTGSLVSRLPSYFDRSHCETDVSASEKRRLYEWIDAMAPYYTTYYSARPGSRGDRDRWGDNREAQKIADWYAQGFTPVYQRRCESCHGPIQLHERYEWGGKWSWIDLSQPEWSPALTAHLAQSAGGRGLTESDFGKLLNPRWTERRSWLIERWASIQRDYRFMEAALAAGQKVELFRDTQDPDYQALLQAIRTGQRQMGELPEADMPGFINRSAHMSFGGR
ncbi:MAG: HzsA-related protein [Pirellulaceae bacterium]